MPIDVKKNRKKEARKLRKKGMSYSEIQKALALPKSTIASWVRRLKLTDEQKQRLDERRLLAAQKNTARRSQIVSKYVSELKSTSSKKIGILSKRELWLMGVMLYWREGMLHRNDFNLRKGVHFSSSDPSLIKLFMKWLQEIGGLKTEEIIFDLFTEKKAADKSRQHWSKITGFPQEHFKHVYQHISDFLRIRVRASSMLARQIAGWVEGISKSI